MLLRNARPSGVNRFFGRAQMASAAAMGFMHGTNDAQKTMGIIALSLLAATKAGQLEHLPAWLSFLHTPEPAAGKPMEIALWIKVVCALTMAAGTAAGGWRIVKTLGHKMVKLHPIHGFAAETSSAAVILAATHLGIPVSTTHNISAAIMGVGGRQTVQRDQMERGRAHGVGLGPHTSPSARCWPTAWSGFSNCSAEPARPYRSRQFSGKPSNPASRATRWPSSLRIQSM